jgi:hypothetical protein
MGRNQGIGDPDNQSGFRMARHAYTPTRLHYATNTQKSISIRPPTERALMIDNDYVIAFGNSHLTAIRNGYHQMKSRNNLHLESDFIHLHEDRYNPLIEWNGGIVYNASLEIDIKQKLSDRSAKAVFASIIGSEHYIWSITGMERPFDIILPFMPHLPRIKDTEILPYTSVVMLFEENVGPHFNLIANLSKKISVPIYHILPPPPVTATNEIIENSPDYFKGIIEKFGVPDKILRYKLWLMWVHTAKKFALENSYATIDPPAEALDADGFMKEAFCAKDAVHANSQYGELVWQQIHNLIEG